MDCLVIPWASNDTSDTEWFFHMRRGVGFSVDGKTMMELKCTKDGSSRIYEHVFRMVNTRAYAQSNITVREGLNLYVKDLVVSDFNIERID